MPDLESMAERILDWDRLLQPIPGENPSGRSLRNQPAYDAVRDGLRPAGLPPVGATQREPQALDFRPVIRDATALLSRETKDLDIAVWLTEALIGEYGMAALAEGILLIQSLLEAFWPTIFPEIDEDGDEGFRAKPISRLNQAFTAPILQMRVTADPRSPVQFTLSQYNASREVPPAAKSATSSELQEKREKALAEGTPSPEDVDQAIEGTALEFYRQAAEDLRRSSEAVEQLQQACNRLFQTDDRPYLEKLSNQLEGLRNTIESLGATKAPPPPPPPPPPATSVQQDSGYAPPAITGYAAASSPAAAPPVAAPAVGSPEGIPALAASMRQADSSDPVPYMLLRSWRFGPMIGRGTPVDEQQLEAPSTEIRTALRRAVLNADWWDVLEKTETAMAQECGRCWLDIQFHAHRAAGELGLTGVATAVRGMLGAYLQALPDLKDATMLDGSPAAGPETLAWIRGDVLVDPNQARKESLDEVRAIDLEEHRDVFEGRPPDAFEVAESELAAGRFAEAFRVLSEAIGAESAGRGRAQRKVQLAKVCLEAQQFRIALPMLREVCRTIEDMRLDAWEPKEFAAAPLAMLYTCLLRLDESPEERQRAYDRLCSLHPMKALELAGGA